ncbi:MAG: dihydrolipoyl dehydrogenase [Candidatus Coatesbacteria bacterium]|nr:dihydrolipoyl dehydrogenase [Candidatus Coatesbacteria bacterium]
MDYQVIFLGGGPAGYVGAIYAAKHGLKTAIVEKDLIGGTCLNRGCIPTKTLLASTRIFYQKEKSSELGWKIDNLSFNWDKIRERRESVPYKLRQGIEYLFKKLGIDLIRGSGKILEPHKLMIDNGEREVSFDNLIISTGSRPQIFPFLKPDGINILISTDLLKLNEIPENLAIIGAGAIGMEFATIYHALGTKITIIEYLPEVLPLFDRALAKRLRLIYKKRGINILIGSKVTGCDIIDYKCKINIEGVENPVLSDKILLATGVVPNSENIGLAEIGIEQDKRGYIKVNDKLVTSYENIFAVGDVIGGKQLAHKASFEAKRVIDIILGKNVLINPVIPGIAYTEPEFAMAGLTEEECREKNLDFATGQFPYQALGRAIAENDIDGQVKVLIDTKSKKILGAHILGNHSDNLVQIISQMMDYGKTVDDIEKLCFSHPSYTEIIEEAILDSIKMAIHKI